MTLGDYLNEMRLRHPRLSMRQMSLEAGLSPSVAEQIIKGATGARPKTLKALADRWGDDNNYRKLMDLAGHPLLGPSTRDDDETPTLRDLFAISRLLNSERQRGLLNYARFLLQEVEHIDTIDSADANPSITSATTTSNE